MLRAIAIAVIMLVWFDELTMNGRYTDAAIHASRSIMHFAFRV